MPLFPIRDPIGRRVLLPCLALVGVVVLGGLLGPLWGLAFGIVGAGILASTVVQDLARIRRRIAQLAIDVGADSDENQPETGASLDVLASRLELARESLAEARRLAEGERDDVLGILEATNEGILVIGEGHRVEMLNDAARRLLAPAIDPLGRSLEEVVREQALLGFARELLDKGNAAERTHRLSVGNEQRFVSLSGSLVPGTPERRRAVIVLRDLSQLKYLESVRTDFVANVTHEMRSPLSSILGYAETLEDDPDLPPTLRDSTQRILRNAHRLDAIIRDLIELSRLEHETGPELKDTHVPQLLDGIARTYRERATERGIELTAEVAPDLEYLRLDPGLLHQALTNLIDNAVKYTPEGGHIAVRASTAAEGSGQALVLSVEDDGTGIPTDQQARIFERFYRVDSGRARSVGGTGLGLAIVKHACALHGGRISLDSSGAGSTFTIVVPLTTAPG